MNVLFSEFSLVPNRKQLTSKRRALLVVVALFAFILSGMPKLRVVAGMPLYAIDFIVLYLLIKTGYKQKVRYRGFARILVNLLSYYAVFVALGELRGGLVYQMPLEMTYMLFRLAMALSLTYILPRQIQSLAELKYVVKGLCLGLLLSATIAILYSLPATRGLTDTVFSIKALAPDGDQIAGAADLINNNNFEGNSRGRTLIGVSTFSSGVMAALWPFVFMGSALLPQKGFWNHLRKVAFVVLPLGILATYGRSAWLSVVLVLIAIVVWGSARARAKLVLCLLLASLTLAPLGVDMLTSKFPLINRVVRKTQVTIEHGAERESEAERFLAYIEPFEHVVKHPSFLLIGSGAAQRRQGGNAYGEAESASHAIPGMAYYAYGAGGALCQIGFMFFALRLVTRRLQQAKRHLPSLTWIWRSLIGCWFGLLPWWCFGHGIVTAPRGAMVFFLFIGLILACDQIFTTLCAQAELSKRQSWPSDGLSA